MKVISPIFSFPAISWWASVLDTDVLLLDKAEHFEKMTCRNRYRIAGSNGEILLSIPVKGGRNNRAPMKDIKIAPGNWQQQHWRTLASVYGRSPFFEYYSPSLQQLFENTYTYLIDFNLATVAYIKKHFKLALQTELIETYIQIFDGTDLRNNRLITKSTFPEYYQAFNERTGFLPDLSILDLLFSEGPTAVKWIEKNKALIV